jgi:hypothetical protein
VSIVICSVRKIVFADYIVIAYLLSHFASRVTRDEHLSKTKALLSCMWKSITYVTGDKRKQMCESYEDHIYRPYLS